MIILFDLFDLDDTLVDHQSAFRAGTRALHRYLSSTLSLDEFAQRWSAAHRRYYDRYLAGEISHDDQRRGRTRGSGSVLKIADQSVL
jgi:putative hydrolase of the HAD superfamily